MAVLALTLTRLRFSELEENDATHGMGQERSTAF